MPYITNKKRDRLVKKVNQNYALRKILICVTVASLILVCVFAVLSLVKYSEATQTFWEKISKEQPSWDAKTTFMELVKAQCGADFSVFNAWFDANNVMHVDLSGFGIGICVWIGITVALGIWAVVLILAMKSPKQGRKMMSTLQGAALSGKKLGKNATQTYRERATSAKNRKKGNYSK